MKKILQIARVLEEEWAVEFVFGQKLLLDSGRDFPFEVKGASGIRKKVMLITQSRTKGIEARRRSIRLA